MNVPIIFSSITHNYYRCVFFSHYTNWICRLGLLYPLPTGTHPSTDQTRGSLYTVMNWVGPTHRGDNGNLGHFDQPIIFSLSSSLLVFPSRINPGQECGTRTHRDSTVVFDEVPTQLQWSTKHSPWRLFKRCVA